MHNQRVKIAIGVILLFSLAACLSMIITSRRVLDPPPEPGVFLVADDGYEKLLTSSGPPAENAIYPTVDHAHPEIAFWQADTSFAWLAFGSLDDVRFNPELTFDYSEERYVTPDGVLISSFVEPLSGGIYCFVQMGQPQPFDYYCFNVLE